MSRTAVVAIDQGTTSTRVAVVGADGHVVASAQREHVQHFPHAGWVEHDPTELWEAVRELTVLALARAHRGPRPHRPGPGLLLLRVQDPLDPGRGPGGPRAVGRGAAAGRDRGLVWNLTGGVHGGVHVTDVTNASRTLLMDLETGRWSAPMLELFGLDPEEWEAMAPRIVPSVGVLGEVTGHETLAGVPVAGVLGDQQAACFGQALFRPGDTKNTYGTGCFLLQHTGTQRPTSAHGLVSTVAYQRAGEPMRYALEGSVAVAGALVQWLRDGLGIISTSEEVEAAAATVPDNGGVVIVPAFAVLFAPHWRADARGLIAGLTGFAHRGHLARAAVEATAYQSRDLLEALTADTGTRIRELRVDGGMTANAGLLQFQADILDLPVARPAVAETTVMGAAWAAGLAVGVWPDEAALCSLWREDRRWEPAMAASVRERLLDRWRRAVEASLGWA